MTLNKYLNERERKLERNKLENWIDRLNNAIAGRQEWDKQVEVCDKIRANKIPIMDSGSDLADFTDKFYKDNWILNANLWKLSHILASEITVDVKSRGTADNDDPNREYLEMEVNYTMDEFDMIRETPDVISDWVWYGYGVSYMPWNHMKVDRNWRTGVPELQYHPAKAFWVDESANHYGWKNKRWVFAKFGLDIDDAKEMYPKHKEKIIEIMSNQMHGDADGKKDIFDVYLCQYKSAIRLEMVDVTWTDMGQEFVEQVYYKEIEDFLMNVDPNRQLPDNIIIGDKYMVEKECWFQFFFSPDIMEMLTEIEYIGGNNFFQILWGLKTGDALYPTNWTYLLSDLLDIKTVAMTLAAIHAIKSGNPMPMVEQGAIRNMQEFKELKNSLDYVAEISAEWREQNPGQAPITFAEGRFDPNTMMMLNNYITEAIKSSTGNVDSTRGVQEYAGQSGVQTAALQSAAAIYTKQDEFAFKGYLKQLTELLLQHIGENRIYEHQLVGINDFGQDETMTINEGDVATWQWEEYYTIPLVENTPEAIKQLKRQEAIQLRQGGSISNLDMLRMLDYPNAMQLEQNRIQENQMMQLAQFLMENPDVFHAIMSGVGGDLDEAEEGEAEESEDK